MKQFWFDGVGSGSLGLHITGSATYGAPERDMETISIPGRNGDLIIDKGRYKNISVSYPVSICRDFPERAAEVRAWLLSRPGYRRLEDDYHPDYFRLAAYKGPLGFDVGPLNRTGEGTIAFDCKPQRFLKTGELPILIGEFLEETQLFNPTAFPAKPLIQIWGSGEGIISVTSAADAAAGETSEIEIAGLDGNVVIDSESMDVYKLEDDGSVSRQNGVVSLPHGFPELEPGMSSIMWLSGFESHFSRVEITPRWWTL